MSFTDAESLNANVSLPFLLFLDERQKKDWARSAIRRKITTVTWYIRRIVPQWTSFVNTYSCTENYPKSLFGRRLSRHSDPVWKTLQLAMLFLAWHGEMTTLPFLLKESCSLWGQGRRFIQDQKVTGQRYSKTTAFRNAQENNVNIVIWMQERNGIILHSVQIKLCLKLIASR